MANEPVSAQTQIVIDAIYLWNRAIISAVVVMLVSGGCFLSGVPWIELIGMLIVICWYLMVGHSMARLQDRLVEARLAPVPAFDKRIVEAAKRRAEHGFD